MTHSIEVHTIRNDRAHIFYQSNSLQIDTVITDETSL